MLKSLIQSPWNQWKCSHWLQGALPQALHGSSCHATRALGSAQRCGSGRLSTPHPLGRHAGTGVGILPQPLTYAPPRLRKKNGKQHFCPRVFVRFHFFPVHCGPWGLCHAGVVPHKSPSIPSRSPRVPPLPAAPRGLRTASQVQPMHFDLMPSQCCLNS